MEENTILKEEDNLKLEHEKKIESPQGGLIEKRFETKKGSIEEVHIVEIQDFSEIPDYTDPTSFSYPTIIKTPTSCHCIDGYEMVQKAKDNGKEKILCIVYNIDKLSTYELALRKVAIRTIPQGGRPRYPELIRNTIKLKKLLLECNDNLIFYSHGKARKGSEYTNNQKENLRTLLAERLGKSVTTISKYLNHGLYINDESFQTLIESNAEKEFFEKAQLNRTYIIKNMRHKEASEKDMESVISKVILEMLQEYREKGAIKNRVIAQQEKYRDDLLEQTKKDHCIIRQPKKFNHWVGNDDVEEDQTATIESIRSEVIKVAQKLLDEANNSELSHDQLNDSIKLSIHNLSELLVKSSGSLTKQNPSSSKEVA